MHSKAPQHLSEGQPSSCEGCYPENPCCTGLPVFATIVGTLAGEKNAVRLVLSIEDEGYSALFITVSGLNLDRGFF